VELNGDKGLDVLCRSSLVRNSLAAVMLIDWLVDISSVDQQRQVSEAVCQLCTATCWNAMQCSKAGMITSVVRCVQRSASSSLDMSVVGESKSITTHALSVQVCCLRPVICSVMFLPRRLTTSTLLFLA